MTGPVCRPYERADAEAFGEDYDAEIAAANERATSSIG